MTVYILYSLPAKKFYAGQTDDFDLRIIRHNSGMVKTTKPGIPWVKAWTCEVDTRSEALLLEKKIKKRGLRRFLIDLGVDSSVIVEEVASRS